MKYYKISFIFLCFFSCANTPQKKIDSIYVMVYDYYNSEVMNVTIYIDGEEVGKTDIYGRLMFPSYKYKECTVRAEKAGYEIIEMKTILSPGQLFYFRLGTAVYYAEKAEESLDKNDIDMACAMIDKALEIEDRKDWRFLKDVIVRRVKNEK